MNERTEIIQSKPQGSVRENEVRAQKKYKDTVFRLLFSDRKRALSLYNGQDKIEERMELKLSDSFLVPAKEPELELKVTVLNINAGMNEELKERCPDLKQYMQYVDMVRAYNKGMPLKDAVIKAVDECIQGNILREFLMKQKAEVIKMSIYEFDEEREMRLIREDEREIGREEGVVIGLRRSMALNKVLLADNRIEDLKRAADDEAYMEELCREYCI